MTLQRREEQAKSGENLHWEMCVIKPLNLRLHWQKMEEEEEKEKGKQP